LLHLQTRMARTFEATQKDYAFGGSAFFLTFYAGPSYVCTLGLREFE
jgi:hypothetical protein